MGGLPPSETRALSWWEYQGMLWHWAERHRTDDEQDEVEAPDAAFVMKRQAQLERAGIAKVLH